MSGDWGRASFLAIALAALIALGGEAAAEPNEVCDPSIEAEDRFCVLGDLSISANVAGKPFAVDASFENTSPNEAAPTWDKNVWLQSAAILIDPNGIPAPQLTPSEQLPNGLLIAGEPLSGSDCTEPAFTGCEAGHGTFVTEVTNSPSNFFDGFYTGSFGIDRIVNIADTAGTEDRAHYRVDFEGCVNDLPVVGTQCSATSTEIHVPEPAAVTDPFEIRLPARFQMPVQGANADVALSSATTHLNGVSSTLETGAPADKAYAVARLPSECGAASGQATLTAADARTVTISRSIEITGCTTTTVTARARKRKVIVRGTVGPGVSVGTVEIALRRKKGGSFKPFANATAPIGEDGSFQARMRRPRKPTRCRVTATYPGDETHAASAATKRFRC